MSLGQQRTVAFALVLIFVAVQAGVIAPAASITNLGVLPGGTASYAAGVSADGSAVAGTSRSAASKRAFRWTAEGGMHDLGTLPGETYSHADAISGDGSTVPGESSGNGFRWTLAGGMQRIAEVAPWAGWQVTGINGDGANITLTEKFQKGGFADYAYRWTVADGWWRCKPTFNPQEWI